MDRLQFLSLLLNNAPSSSSGSVARMRVLLMIDPFITFYSRIMHIPRILRERILNIGRILMWLD